MGLLSTLGRVGVRQMKNTRLPALRAREGSWVVTSPQGEVRELFDETNAAKALDAGWNVETIGEYLARINGGMR
jgi:hypothetical protein